MAHETKSETGVPVVLSRTLGVSEVTLLGVGALLGGGIFTLLGHAAGLAGGGLIFAILLGAFISFLNLNSYVSLATTFPQAGGGYNWVRAGLGELQGFMAGWFSWMGSSVACSLYAVSFGFFASEFIFSFLNIPVLLMPRSSWVIFFALSVVIVFSFVNYRGVKFSTRSGGYLALFVLAILFLYIIFGFKQILEAPALFQKNFTPLLPLGLVGVTQAAALFYIAFEGSEIQAQSGEEAKDPARVLKISLFGSWFIITTLYLLISAVITGATDGLGDASWKFLGHANERAIIESAQQFLPFGYILMITGGLIANVGALNATIYSASRVLFAMARDKFVWQKLGAIHSANKTPYLALLLSSVFIAIVVMFLPLKDIASAADILFIALFLQLNAAYIELRRKKPEARWQYVVPFGVVMPITAIVLYIILGISLFHVSAIAVYFMAIWLLLGLVNYLGYTRVQREEDLESEVRYEHTTRFRQKFGYRVIFPVARGDDTQALSQIALAMAKEKEGELLALHIHEVPPSLPLDVAFNSEQEKRILNAIEDGATRQKSNVETRIVSARSVSDTILETIRVEDGDLLVMGWNGYIDTKGFIFGKKVDTMLHRAKCDLVVAKIRPPASIRKIFIPVPVDKNPNLRFTGMVASALAKCYGATITVGMVVPEATRNGTSLHYRALLQDYVDELKFKTPDAPELTVLYSDNIVSAILKEAASHDVIIMPADRGRITHAVGMGSIPEQVAKHAKQTVIMAKGYRGIIQPFSDYIRSRL